MPPVRRATVGVRQVAARPPSSLPVDRLAGGVAARTRGGTPGATRATCRSGSGRPTGCRCCWRPGRRRRRRRAMRRRGPGWFWAAGQHHEAPGSAATSSAVPSDAVGAGGSSGSSALSGTKTVPPPFTVWSTPWSKNWPKNVNRLVVRRREADVGGHVRDEQRLVRRHAAGGQPVGGSPAASARWCTGTRPGCPGCAPGTRPRRPRPGWSTSGRRSGC